MNVCNLCAVMYKFCACAVVYCMLYVDMCSVYAVGMYLACMCGLWNVLHIHMYYMYVLCMCAVYMCVV